MSEQNRDKTGTWIQKYGIFLKINFCINIPYRLTLLKRLLLTIDLFQFKVYMSSKSGRFTMVAGQRLT